MVYKKFDNFVDYFKDKSIAIIGSGASILNDEYGEVIDCHDIVVRINRSYPYEKYQKYVGTRTDVWSFGMGGRDDLRKPMHELFSNRKYSMYPWYASVWVPDYIKNLDNHINLPPSFSRTAEKSCGGTPATTGADTVHFIVKGTEYKCMSIFGIDCYTTDYWFKDIDDSIKIEQTTKDENAHKVKLEEKFLQELVNSKFGNQWYR